MTGFEMAAESFMWSFVNCQPERFAPKVSLNVIGTQVFRGIWDWLSKLNSTVYDIMEFDMGGSAYFTLW